LSHNRISIQSDSDFANQALAEGWPGNGSSNNPYSIEGLYINCTDMGIPCIEISRTTVHFTIRHCTLLGGPSPYGVIGLSEVSNGYLLNNTFTSLGRGIIVTNSTFITIANSNCSSRGPELGLGYSTQITLFNNTCLSDPAYADWSNIVLIGSTQNKVLNNTCFSSLSNIELHMSGGNAIANNTLYGRGLKYTSQELYHEFGALDEFRQALVRDNTVNGKALLFWQDQVGGTLPEGFGQAVLVNCSQTTVRDTIVTGCTVGILLVYCDETTVVNISCVDNIDGLVLYGGLRNLVVNNTFIHNGELGSGSGVSLTNSSYNILGNNTFLDNSYGIILAGDHNMMWNNTCMGSTVGIGVLTASYNTIGGSWITGNAFGLHFWDPGTYDNLIEGNIFADNGVNALDQYENQNYYDYNYWSNYYGPDENGDGVGDIAFHVAGTRNIYDHRPLMLPPGSPVTWLEVPTDQYFFSGSYISYDLDATATPPGLDQWWLSDITLFTIDQYGVLTNLGTLPMGTHWVQVWVSDWMGNTITASFAIIVYESSSMSFIIGTVAVISTAAFVSIIGVVVLRQRRATSLPPMEPFGDKRPPVDQWHARCAVCGSRLFGDEGFCPGCGNRVTKSRSG
jgi:parallel beta-helix repeat protein